MEQENQTELITRKEARSMGLTIGRMDYLLKIGQLQYAPNTHFKFFRSDVEKWAAVPSHWTIKKSPNDKVRGPYIMDRQMELAIASLTVCAQLLKSPAIKKSLGNPTLEEIIEAAQTIENRLNWKRKKKEKKHEIDA